MSKLFIMQSNFGRRASTFISVNMKQFIVMETFSRSRFLNFSGVRAQEVSGERTTVDSANRIEKRHSLHIFNTQFHVMEIIVR